MNKPIIKLTKLSRTETRALDALFNQGHHGHHRPGFVTITPTTATFHPYPPQGINTVQDVLATLQAVQLTSTAVQILLEKLVVDLQRSLRSQEIDEWVLSQPAGAVWTYVIGPFPSNEAAKDHAKRFKIGAHSVSKLVRP